MVWSFSNPNLCFTTNDVSLNSMDGSSNKFGDFTPLQNANQWYHFLTINTVSETKLYVNANLLGEATYASPETRNFTIGKGGYTFKGLIDDVRIDDRPLSLAEVQTLYNLGQ